MAEGKRGRATVAPADASETRCGFIALIGAPNAGKSTLINALVGTKVAIVSHKVQTTRALLRGIATAGGTQLVLIDTPGIFAPKRRLDRAMVTNAWAGAQDADIAGVLVDAKRGIDEETDALLARLAEIRQPKILLINKVDLVEKSVLLGIAKAAIDWVPGVYRLMQIPSSTIDYFVHPTFYDPANTLADLKGTDLQVPPLRSYLPALVSFMRVHPELGSEAMA